MGKAKFFHLESVSKKFSYFDEKVSFSVVRVEHSIHAIDIREAPESYNFLKHEIEENYLFRVTRKSSKERVSFLAVGVEHPTGAKDNREAL